MDEMKKAEAIKRMKVLKLHEDAIREFEEDGKLNLSKSGGFLYWLDDDQKRRVREFEQKHNALVYHVIHNYVGGDEHFVYLFVSNYEEEWARDLADLRDGYPFVYVENVSADWCSEFGCIGIKSNSGGLMRTA